MDPQAGNPEQRPEFTAGRAAAASGEASTWPGGGFDTLTWEGRADIMQQGMSLRDLSGQTYKAFVPPFIADAHYQPSSRAATLAEESAVAIARFDERHGRHLAPFSTLLLGSESAASSRIENLTASARSLGEAELGSTDKVNATQVVRNVRTMETALAAAADMDTASVLRMHEVLMEGTADEDAAGQWRQQQVWIGSSVVSPIGATYIAPAHERVPELMNDVMAYARRRDVPVMVQAAIAHAQFETIHPFTDGNGRTGHALLHAMLKRRGTASRVTVPVSSGLLANVSGYHDALTAFREGDPDLIITLCAEASFLAIENGTLLAADVAAITESWNARIVARKDAAVWKVLDLLARQPVVNALSLQDRLGLDYRRAKRAMDELEDAEIVVGVDKFKQGRFWRAPDMLKALDAFADRAGRRSAPLPELRPGCATHPASSHGSRHRNSSMVPQTTNADAHFQGRAAALAEKQSSSGGGS